MAEKKSAKKTTKPRSKKKAKKPKVKISKRKALILAAAIFGVCGLFLALSVALSSPRKPKFKPIDNGELRIDNSQAVENEKNVAKDSEKLKVENEKKKKEHPKKVEPTKIETQKREEQKEQSKVTPELKPKTTELKTPTPKPTETPKPVVVPPVPTPPVEPKLKEPAPTPTPKPTPTPEPPKPISKYNFPPAVNNSKLVFLFDDGGQNLFELQKFLELPMPITIAVLPKLPYSAESGRRILAAGKQLMMHQPMQAINPAVNPGPGAITPEMSISEINQLLAENVASIGKIAGMNNHEGSKISENQIQIGAVLDFCNENKMFYLDSRTTAQTRAPQAAMERGIDIYERDVFLDNEKTRENILHEIGRGLEIANKKGRCIMIGHIWSADILPKVLNEVYPELVENGYKIEVLK